MALGVRRASQPSPLQAVIAGSRRFGQAVRFARGSPRWGGGYGAGLLELIERALPLRTLRMRGVRVDPAGHTARADVGTLGQDAGRRLSRTARRPGWQAGCGGAGCAR